MRATKRVLGYEDIDRLAAHASAHIDDPVVLCPIPRGGVPAAYAIARYLNDVTVSTERNPDQPFVLVDDIAATGNTLQRYANGITPEATMKGKPDYAVTLLKREGAVTSFGIFTGETLTDDEWVTFPWEVADDSAGPEDAVRRLIEYLGDDSMRPGLVETPARVLRMFDEIREAGKVDNALTTFESSTAKDLVIVRNIPLYSLCEHHMVPYYGDASVAYIPEGRVLGLSKIARLVGKHASGLTIQEELSSVIAHSVQEAAKCKSVAVVTRATHMCMVMRGVKAHNSSTVASAMLGEFRDNPTLRMEFMSLKEG